MTKNTINMSFTILENNVLSKWSYQNSPICGTSLSFEKVKLYRFTGKHKQDIIYNWQINILLMSK